MKTPPKTTSTTGAACVRSIWRRPMGRSQANMPTPALRQAGTGTQAFMDTPTWVSTRSLARSAGDSMVAAATADGMADVASTVGTDTMADAGITVGVRLPVV